MLRLRRSPLTLLDAVQFGERGTGCVYLLRAEKTALVDTGTAASVALLLQLLRGVYLDYVFLTHVHLDHAGGAGDVAAAHPETTFVVHPRGLPYLVDPARLLSGVRAASPELAPLYGDPRPISPERLLPCADGDVFPLGPTCHMVALETLGHASHHVAYSAPDIGVLFVGDAVGHHHTPTDMPLTVPPRFDRVASRDSIHRMLELHPTTLAFTHFGRVSRPNRLLMSYPERVDAWFNRVAALRARHGDEAVADIVLSDARYKRLSDAGKSMLRLCVRGALLTLDYEALPAGAD